MNIPRWIERMMWRWKYHDCLRIALKIAVIGQGDENGAAQKHLDRAKDELYAAAHIFTEWGEK